MPALETAMDLIVFFGQTLLSTSLLSYFRQLVVIKLENYPELIQIQVLFSQKCSFSLEGALVHRKLYLDLLLASYSFSLSLVGKFCGHGHSFY